MSPVISNFNSTVRFPTDLGPLITPIGLKSWMQQRVIFTPVVNLGWLITSECVYIEQLLWINLRLNISIFL